MNWDFQDVAALTIVSVALGYVGSRIYSRLHPKTTGGCEGGCFGCDASNTDSNSVVTTIEIAKSVDR